MEKSSATSSDALVLSHFSRQIFQALGYPDRSTAIIKRKWRVAVSYTFDKICWLTIIWCNYHLMFILGNICGLLSSVLRSKQPNRSWSPTCNVNTSLWHNHHVSPHHVDADPAQQILLFLQAELYIPCRKSWRQLCESPGAVQNIPEVSRITNIGVRDRSSRGKMQSCCCLTLPHNTLILTYILLSRLQSLNFHLKVFHPQNCVYSIIADIKRYTLENRTANESNGQSEQNGRFINFTSVIAHTSPTFGLHI